MSNEPKSTNEACQGELSDAELSQAAGGASRDYAETQAPGGQCYSGVMVDKTANNKFTTVTNSRLGNTTSEVISNPEL